MVNDLKKKTVALTSQNNLMVDLTFHKVPVSLIEEFTKNIVLPYYDGNLNAALQDLILKVLAEQDFIHSHITHVRSANNS